MAVRCLSYISHTVIQSPSERGTGGNISMSVHGHNLCDYHVGTRTCRLVGTSRVFPLKLCFLRVSADRKLVVRNVIRIISEYCPATIFF
jgi:hypothetical protein